MTDALVPAASGDDLRVALIRAVGWDRLSEPQRELALSIAQRYNLDPMLRHLVMIEGAPYITRDGLLHVAHAAKVMQNGVEAHDFDGIEVSDPVLDEKADAKGRRFWRARCKVWRKSFSRPFEYPGRYPDNGRNSAYAEEMAIKVAEVMTLRRAFDVSAPTIEERWVDEDEFPTSPAAEAPSSLTERISARAAALEAQEAPVVDVIEAQSYPDDVATDNAGDETSPPAVEPADLLEVVDADQIVGAALAGIVEGVVEMADAIEVVDANGTIRESPGTGFAMHGVEAPADGTMVEIVADGPIDPTEPMFVIPATATTAEQEAFKVWAQARPDKVRRVVREMYPDATRLLELTPAQMTRVRAVVDAEEAEGVNLSPAGLRHAAAALEDPDEPAPMSEARAKAKEEEEEAEERQAGRCGAESPLSGAVCNLDAGHKGVHRNGLREAWDR